MNDRITIDPPADRTKVVRGGEIRPGVELWWNPQSQAWQEGEPGADRVSELDEKLKKICEWLVYNSDYQDIDDSLSKIRQAFKEAGYVQKEWRSVGTVNGERFEHIDVYTPAKLGFEPVPKGTFAELKTGRGWYDRFTEELSKLGQNNTGNQGGWVTHSLVDEAARRAAGIEEES